jgi:DNA-directed RNA polymerase I, II, and III subunit RPABC2
MSKAHQDREMKDDHVDDDNESVYDETVDDVDDIQDREDPKVVDDEDEDEDEDEDVKPIAPKARQHVYHQIPDSTEIKIVAPGNRITSEYMTIYEYTMVVGTRATHISEGSVLYTDPQGLYDPRDIARKEINENKCPLSITRKVSPAKVEVWEVNEMIKPKL